MSGLVLGRGDAPEGAAASPPADVSDAPPTAQAGAKPGSAAASELPAGAGIVSGTTAGGAFTADTSAAPADAAGVAAGGDVTAEIVLDGDEDGKADGAIAEADSALLAAVDAGDIGAVQTLLAGGADPNVRDVTDATPLKLACRRANAAVARVLLRHGARLGDGDEVRRLK